MVVIGHSTTYISESGASPAARVIINTLGAGWLGVVGFFVISGYCISATCDSLRRKPNTVAAYFRRRFRRIFPPYWAALLGTVLLVIIVAWLFGPSLMSDVPRLLPHPGELSPVQWLGNISLIENWRSNAFGGNRLMQLGPAWTLCYEEQFYAVCGLILLVSRRHFFLGTIVVSALTLGLLVAHRTVTGLFIDGNWFPFAAGILLYYQVNYATLLKRRLSAALLLGTAIATICHFPAGSWQIPLFFTAPVVALVFLLLHPLDRQMMLLKFMKPLTFCGTICYSLYLVHWPIVKLVSHVLYLAGLQSDAATLLVTVPICTALALVIAWLFHLAIERRFLNSPSTKPPVEPPIQRPSELSLAGAP